MSVALNFTGGKIRRILVIAHGTKCRSVQQRPVVQMHHEDRCIWRCRVYLIERWHPALGELEFIPASHDPYPLRSRRSLCLVLEHPQAVGQRWHAVPAKFHVVVEATANGMHV